MSDSLKTFLIALVTAVAVQALLGPYILELRGFRRSVAVEEVVAPMGGSPSNVPLPMDGPAMAAPNLEGMAVDQARERFRERGIVIIEDGIRTEVGVVSGTILQQRPAPGAALTNMEIRVIVAKESGVDIPNVVGTPIAQARTELIAAGFQVTDPELEASDQPMGTVIRQVPNAGTKAKAGSAVHLVIAEQAAVEVPKVTGVHLRKAKEALEGVGLAVGTVRRKEHPEYGQDYVLNQVPAAGEKVSPGTAVDLVVVAPD